jgi:hypothetical protein
MPLANQVVFGKSRAGASAPGGKGIVVVGVLTVILATAWGISDRRPGVTILLRTADGRPAPTAVVDHAHEWLASDAALLRVLECVGDEHALPTVEELNELRSQLAVDVELGSKLDGVSRVHFRGQSELGQWIARRLASQFAETGIDRLNTQYGVRASELRAELSTAWIKMHQLTSDADVLGREIAALQGQLRDARVASRRGVRLGQPRVPMADRQQQAALLGKRLARRGELLDEIRQQRQHAEAVEREITVVGARRRELAGLHLVATPEWTLLATRQAAQFSLLALLVGVTFAGGRSALLHHRTSGKLERVSHARFDLGVPVVCVGLSRSPAAA